MCDRVRRQLIVNGYNTPANPLALSHHELCVRAGAYENSLFVVAAAKAGIEEGVHLIGGSWRPADAVGHASRTTTASRVPLEWDASMVTRATEPAVAADDTNQVIAVSPAALYLLGYDDEHELVGERLLQLIPSRFHEAHLTGFTLHFLTGRNTLLGQPTTVPARRWDGTETTVELLLQAHTAPHGRKVFVARLRPL